jgi:hypothetical protein
MESNQRMRKEPFNKIPRKKRSNEAKSSQSIVGTAVKSQQYEPRAFSTNTEDTLTETVLSYRIKPLASFTHLSPGAARMMAENCKHRDEIWSAVFNLDGLLHLGRESAEALAKLPVTLSFNGLTELSVDVAMALAVHEAPLSLDGVTSISPEIAVGLAMHQGDLSLRGLRVLSLSVAKALANHQEGLNLEQVTRLEHGVLLELSKHKGEVRLCSIENLEDGDLMILANAKHLVVNSKLREKSEIHLKEFVKKNVKTSTSDLKKVRELIKDVNAQSLSLAFGILNTAGGEFDWLQLFPKSRLKTLLSTWDTAIWRVLASEMRVNPVMFSVLCEEAKTRLNSNSSDWSVHSRYLRFCASLLDDITDDIISLLSKARIELRCDKKSLSEGEARLLAGFEGELLLPHLCYFPDDPGHIALAEKLAAQQTSQMSLRLNGLTSLSDAAAECLSKYCGNLHLEGLIGLSDAAAESLSRQQGCLFLTGLTSLSDSAAESLRRHEMAELGPEHRARS